MPYERQLEIRFRFRTPVSEGVEPNAWMYGGPFRDEANLGDREDFIRNKSNTYLQMGREVEYSVNSGEWVRVTLDDIRNYHEDGSSNLVVADPNQRVDAGGDGSSSDTNDDVLAPSPYVDYIDANTIPPSNVVSTKAENPGNDTVELNQMSDADLRSEARTRGIDAVDTSLDRNATISAIESVDRPARKSKKNE